MLTGSTDAEFMRRAIVLALQGQGRVEPNPMVGAVIVREGRVVGEGYHERFGGPHAEIAALRVAGESARGGTLHVSLEPCCHYGKTPPCTDAILQAGLSRVVIAMRDPFPQVAGGGIAQLTQHGVQVEVGLCEQEARELNAPYLKLVETGRPWVIAKWAMTLDGKLATSQGDSRWISGEASRAIVHALRGRVDAIVVGRRTAERDDPLLTARGDAPPLRVATRVVLDSRAQLASGSQLVRSAALTPTLVVASPGASAADISRLREHGCEVLVLAGSDRRQQLALLLDELGRRRMTNVLVEGGGELLGGLFDADAIDEVHAFIAPTLFGGAAAPTPLAGTGIAQVRLASVLADPTIELVGSDVYVHGRSQRRLP